MEDWLINWFLEYNILFRGLRPKQCQEQRNYQCLHAETHIIYNKLKQGSMEGVVIGDQYQITERLGSGSFGEIYEVECLDSVETYAIKIEKNKTQAESRLLHEARLYKTLMGKGTADICRVYAEGTHDNWNYMIMDKLAFSLEQLFQTCNRTFSVKTVCEIARQAISRLETLHRQGYVHRDLKPDNFMVGYGHQFATVYLIDLGLAKAYINTNTRKLIERKGGKSLVGTARYVSISSHDGFEQSPKDDLQSLGYLLLYFLKGSLPWQGIKSQVKLERFKKIAQVKKSTPLSKLWEGFPKCFLEYSKYVQSLTFQSEPNYEEMRGFFPDHKDSEMDWEKYIDISEVY